MKCGRVQRARQCHERLLALCIYDDVEFSAEDAVRSEIDFLVKVFNAVIKVGAKTINVPDTVGYSIPGVWGERMKALINQVENSTSSVYSKDHFTA